MADQFSFFIFTVHCIQIPGMENLTEKPKYHTGIVLSGGLVRGFAHLGVLKALNERHIYPDVISGVSAGAIVAAFYGAGYPPDTILEFFEGKRLRSFMKLSLRRDGLMNLKGLRKFMEKRLDRKMLQELDIPVYLTVTNFNTGRPEHLSEGNLIDLVIASASVPVMFRPVHINGNVFFDGGITNNFPVEPIQDDCKEIIGINVNPVSVITKVRGLRYIATRSFYIGVAAETYEKCKNLKYFIEPAGLHKFGYFAISKCREIFEVGYKEAVKVLNV